jgi:hypothetical protein
MPFLQFTNSGPQHTLHINCSAADSNVSWRKIFLNIHVLQTISMVWHVDRLQFHWLTLTAALRYYLSVAKCGKESCCKFGDNAAPSEHWIQLNSSLVISSYILRLVHCQQLINAQMLSVATLHQKNISRPDNVATFPSQYSSNFNLLLIFHKQLHLKLLVS